MMTKQGRKRPLSALTEENPISSGGPSCFDVAQRALLIVLQHWFKPILGWSMNDELAKNINIIGNITVDNTMREMVKLANQYLSQSSKSLSSSKILEMKQILVNQLENWEKTSFDEMLNIRSKGLYEVVVSEQYPDDAIHQVRSSL